MTEVLTEVAKNIPTLIWGSIAGLALWLFHKPLVARLGQVTGFKAVGLELSFVATQLEGAAANANRGNTVLVASTLEKRNVDITKADRERVLQRADRCRAVLTGKRILWIDDSVTNNRRERELLEALGLKVEQVQNNEGAKIALAPDGGGYDLILSDIARPESSEAGLEFLNSYRLRPHDQRVPLIFYISARDETKPMPLGAFGLTNRPDILVHLVIDALERAD